MHMRIDRKVFEKYPQTEIGYLVAKVCVRATDPFVEELKLRLLTHLQEHGINATNFAAHPCISIWRKIYEEDFRVKPKSYRSSIEALLRRLLTGKSLRNICNVVDLYNCCSVLSLLPMGGYDLDKVNGAISIRFAACGETFLGLGERQALITQPNQVVYADASRVMCWLWNHKDAQATCIDETTRHCVFFIDAADGLGIDRIETALTLLSTNLEKIGGDILAHGRLNINSTEAIHDIHTS